MDIAVSDLKALETVSVLKSLNKLWEQFSLFRTSCLKFEGAEEFLTSLVIVFNNKKMPDIMNPDDKSFEFFFSTFTSMIQQSHGATRDRDVLVLKKIWSRPLDGQIFREIVRAFNPKMSIPDPVVDLFRIQLDAANNSEYDPFLKGFFLTYVVKEILDRIEAKEIPSILRIFIIKLNHDYDMSDKPVLYHLHLVQLKIDMSENSVIQYTESLFNVFHLGNIVLKHAIELYNELVEETQVSPILFKLYKDPVSFRSIFNRPAITIFQMMNSLDWKRDKVARTLNSLVKEGYFTIKKSSREKVYINMFFLKILNRIRNNEQIQSILFKFL